MWWIILKKQTTLPGFDSDMVEEMVSPENYNIWISPRPGREEMSPKEMSRLSDKMLKELAKLNKYPNNFIISSAEGSTAWGEEPTFMLTGVPKKLQSKILRMADKYGQDSVAVSEEGQKGASFVTPRNKVDYTFRDMAFEPNPEFYTKYPSGQKLTFKE